MEDQPTINNQNTQQIGQNPINQPIQTPEKKINYWMVSTIVLSIILVIMGVYFLTIIKPWLFSGEKQQSQSNTTPLVVISPSPNPEVIKNEFTCSTTQSYLSKHFNISFNCPSGYKIYESETTISISPVVDTPYAFVFITKPEVTESYWKKDKVESLTKTQIGGQWQEPNPIPGREKESLRRIDNTLISGVTTFSFIDKTPYEGAPLYKYVIPHKESYLYIQVAAEGFSDTASEEQKKIANSLQETVLSIRFTD